MYFNFFAFIGYAYLIFMIHRTIYNSSQYIILAGSCDFGTNANLISEDSGEAVLSTVSPEPSLLAYNYNA